MTEHPPAGSQIASRLLQWMRLPAELAILGACWLVTALPIVTVVLASSALHHVLAERERDDELRLVAAYLAGIRSTWRLAVRLTLVVLPFGLGVIALGLVIGASASTPAAFLALGVLIVLTTAGVALLSTILTVCVHAADQPRARLIRRAVVLWVFYPGGPLVAVVVGATAVAAVSQSFWIAALYAISLPAWLTERWNQRATARLEERTDAQ
ncbi:hypothetical protein [Microbacterium invictum]|uniref:DUF624 domain-containing protein n=1 Tax=Microbacterium invictum TaxID=515415 RepID=A0ABZ0VDE8_9MICO|nr:hypothetical protein [Microbacterium invictum]WQB70696.1 hypothetical protein T9R20_01695 [Microbacterium invictum]